MKRTVPIAVTILIALSIPTVFTTQVQAWLVRPGIYAGTMDPASVYRYDGTTWTLIGTFPDDSAVLSLTSFQGQLFAGTMTPHDYPEPAGIGRVYRYEGGTTWTRVGDNLANEVHSLVVYNGNLYAGTAWAGYFGGAGGGLYRYDGGTTWTIVVDEFGEGVKSAFVWDNLLLIGDILHHNFGHYDGTTFTLDATFGWCESINNFEVYQGTLFAGGSQGNTGVLYNSTDGTTWDYMTIMDPSGGTWGLETFAGNLDIGLGNGTLLGWDGSSYSSIWSTPDGQGIRSLETSIDLQNLFIGTGGRTGGFPGTEPGTGRVYRYDGTTVQLISGDMGNGVLALYTCAALPQQAIPEVPLGTIMVSTAMIIALIGYLAIPRFRRKQKSISP